MLFQQPLLPQTQAYLANCTNRPSAVWVNALNTYIQTLIIDGNWALLDRLWIFCTQYQQGARINVKAPWSTQGITEVNSPTWTPLSGYNGNGTTSYLNTNWTPSTQGVNYAQNSCEFGCVVQTQNGSNGPLDMGCGGAAVVISMQLWSDDAGSFYGVANANGNQDISTTTQGIGMYSIVRTAANACGGFYNGVSVSTSSLPSTGLPPVPLFVGGYNANNGGLNNGTVNLYSMAWVGGVLNHQAFYNAWQTFFNNI